MAALSRSVCSRHFRSVFSYYKSEQLHPVVRKSNWVHFRHFVSNGATGKRVVAQGNLVLAAVGGAAAGAAITFWQSRPKDVSAVINVETEFKPKILDSLPPHPPARKISIPTDSSGLHLVLYQYPTCPFCCKVRAFLDYYGLSYDIVEVDPVLRSQTKWSDYKKVPILLASIGDGKYVQLNDSSVIISALSSHLADPKKNLLDILKCYPSVSYRDEEGAIKTDIQNRYFLMAGEIKQGTKEAIMEEVKWREWADKKLVHVLSPNVYRTTEEALQSFEWFSEVGEWDRLFPSWERNLIVYTGAYAMWLIGKRLKKRHLLKGDVRLSLYDEINTWLSHLKKKQTSFSGGKTPNLADLAVYGVLSSIEGCQAFKDAIQWTNIGDWYFEMKKYAQNHGGSNPMTGI